MNKVLIAVGVLALVAFLVIVINGNNKPKDLRGFSISPKSFNQADFTEFFKKATDGGDVITWAGNVNQLSDEKAAPYVLLGLSKVYNYTPVILVSDPDKDKIIPFVTKQKPPYLAIGVEINRGWISDVDIKSKQFVDIYDAIKEISPKTKVFTVFQLENMKGLNGGLFGGTNDTSKNQWVLLSKFSKSDLLGLTTYPGIIYKDPSDIPDNYYSEIKQYSDKPLAFVEIGWPSSTEILGWESSEEEQGEFINRFFELTSGLPKEFVIWTFLYDQEIQKPFTSLGLIDRSGKIKEAWESWINSQ